MPVSDTIEDLTMNDRCACNAVADNACNDCETAVCDARISADFRCGECCGANASAADLFDDPEAEGYDPNDEDARYIREQRASAVNEDDTMALNQALRALD